MKHLCLLTFGLVYSVAAVFSQDFEIPDYEEKLSYTEFETDYYILDQKDIDNVSLPDKVKFKELKYEREYEKYLDVNNERTTLIKHISTENVYEDWMSEPEMVLIDKYGVALLTKEGKELNRIEHAPEYLKMVPEQENGLLPNYAIPGPKELQQMKAAGYKIEYLAEGFIKITNQSVQIVFNDDLKYIERNQLSKDGEVMYSLKTEFMQLPNGELVFERIRESNTVFLDNNIRAEHVFLRLFSDYSYENTSRIETIEDKNNWMSIQTNNGQTTAIVKYKPFENDKTAVITIYTTNGRIIKSYAVENSGENQLNISELTQGIYIMRIQSEGKSIAEKFIKM